MLTRKVILISILIISFMFSSCTVQKKEEDLTLWAAPNTVKIMQNEKNVEKNPAVIQVESAKNEYENAQFIITPKADVKYYNITLTDLKNSKGEIFSKKNITIYNQHYVNIYTSSNGLFPMGYYPDPLVPLEKAIEKNENNIKAGNNQGIWFTFYVPKDTVSGDYKGEATLNLDGEETKIPVTLTVWDFSLTDESHLGSSFNIWTYPFLDMLTPESKFNTEELYKIYYDFFLDYRISTTFLPNYKYTKPELYVAELKKYANNPKVTNYNLPTSIIYQVKNGLTYGNVNIEQLNDILTEIIRQSILDKTNYVKKAYLYVTAIDEPSPDRYDMVKQVDSSFKVLKYKLAHQLGADYTNGRYTNLSKTYIDELIATIKNIPHVVTAKYDTSLDGYVNTFCPTIDYLNGEKSFKVYSDSAKKNAGHVWSYTCVGPKSPYPSYHIDDNLISSRIMPWIQKKMGIEGNLYWAVNLTMKMYPDGTYGQADVWEDVHLYPDVNGDGQLVYPGSRYNQDEPVTTIRLQSIRDGYEDYEYLWQLEQELNKASEKYGVKLDLNNYISDLNYKLFEGTVPIVDSDALKAARKEIAELILLLKSDVNGVFLLNGVNSANKTATATVITVKNVEVITNGKPLTNYREIKNGYIYTITVPVSTKSNIIEVIFKKDNKQFTVSRLLSNDVKKLFDFEIDREMKRITVVPESKSILSISNNTELGFVTQGKKSLLLQIKNESQNYWSSPSFEISFKDKALDITDTLAVCFDVVNPNLQVPSFGIELIDNEKNTLILNDSFCIENGKSTLRFNIPTSKIFKFKNVVAMKFNIGNIPQNNTNYKIYIDNIFSVNK